jgi:glycerol transport system substrate-binding protein
MSQLWWTHVSTAINGEKTPQVAMDNLALAMDEVLAELQRTGMQHCTPRLNPRRDAAQHLTHKGAPWKKLNDEKPKGETIAYERLLQAWKEGRVQ